MSSVMWRDRSCRNSRGQRLPRNTSKHTTRCLRTMGPCDRSKSPRRPRATRLLFCSSAWRACIRSASDRSTRLATAQMTRQASETLEQVVSAYWRKTRLQELLTNHLQRKELATSPKSCHLGEFSAPNWGFPVENENPRLCQRCPYGAFGSRGGGVIREPDYKDFHMGSQIRERRVAEIGFSASITIPGGLARHFSRGSLCVGAGFYRCRSRQL